MITRHKSVWYCLYILLVLLIMKDNFTEIKKFSVTAFRYAWRPDTKVFPYEDMPPPSRIDNGDNDGKILDDYIGRTKVKTVI